MNIDELISWAKENTIEQRTIEGFKGFLISYKNDNHDEYKSIFGAIDESELNYQIHTISLNLGNWPECSYNTISASLWISYKGKQICSYKSLYTFDGVEEDDFIDFL